MSPATARLRVRPQPATSGWLPAVPLTVLLAEADLDMRHDLRTCLKSAGLRIGRVLEAADGLEGLRLARFSPVDLVITDIVVPGLDGRSLCRAIRSNPDLDRVALLL